MVDFLFTLLFLSVIPQYPINIKTKTQKVVHEHEYLGAIGFGSVDLDIWIFAITLISPIRVLLIITSDRFLPGSVRVVL